MTEYQKTMEHYRHGRDFGMRIGADAMRNRILDLPGMTPELAKQIRAIDVDNFKVKS